MEPYQTLHTGNQSTESIQSKLQELLNLLRQDVSKQQHSPTQTLYAHSAEVLEGLLKAFSEAVPQKVADVEDEPYYYEAEYKPATTTPWPQQQEPLK